MALLARIALAVSLMTGSLGRQQPRAWRIRGDTLGAPAGCSAAAGIAAITAWFAAYNAADSAALIRAIGVGVRGHFTFTTGKFAPTDSFIRAHIVADLLRYVRRRARQHDRMELEAVHFHGWQGRDLGFMPYFRRSAHVLGLRALPGIGKAGYSCNRGITVLNLAPRPRSLLEP
jgi:hypothetical protein